MKLQLLHTDDEDNTINKNTTLVKEINIHLTQVADMKSLVLRLHTSDYNFHDVNYAKLNDFYYFVDTRYYNKNIYLAILSIDYLETYKDTILNSTLDIKHKSTAGKGLKQSNVLSETETKIYKSDTTIKDGSSIILQTTGELVDKLETSGSNDN